MDKLHLELIKRTAKPDVEPDEDDQPGGQMPDLGDEKIGQDTASYMGPDKGPFSCDNCERFSAPRSCTIVEGDIDPKGCCNLFDPKD